MTDPEKKVVSDLLDYADEHFGNHGCNDYRILDTPANREILIKMERWNGVGEDEVSTAIVAEDGWLWTQDYFIMAYFADRLRKELGD